MYQYFTSFSTLDELKAQYKALAKRYHPDCGGSDEIMAQINAEYDRAVEALSHGGGNDARRATQEDTSAFRAAVMAAVSLAGVTVELCGSWLWVTGNTYPHKTALKTAGFSWASGKHAWYWKPESAAARRGQKTTLEAIRAKYGSRVFSAATACQTALDA